MHLSVFCWICTCFVRITKVNKKKGRPAVSTVCCDFINKGAGVIHYYFSCVVGKSVSLVLCGCFRDHTLK